ncbi:hypothetical protein A9Q99_25995 [Gammaproteobacteria bacterium 45_16_T64]|nr:hypothetical protein A9Q99_25995 [Gammaproteobacteria bacterium 45_16_T64]
MDLLDDTNHYIMVVEDLLSQKECDSIIHFIDSNNPTAAPVITLRGEAYKPDIRNNQRVMKTDFELADYLFQRVRHRIPTSIFDYEVVGLNELFRCYRYKKGMQFKPRSDSSYERNKDERSFYTFLIYLNEVEEGGETGFLVEPELSFSPKMGRGILFQHPLEHEGCEVIKGTKYVIRTDVMYRRTMPK